MTRLFNDPADFADEALDGFVAAHGAYARKVHGGVVRSTRSPKGQVAVVVGGGTGHYPAFAGWVGPGIAHGSACGNIFASPSASQVYSVMKIADNGGGVFVSFGNYAGDVLHFGQAAERLRDEGVDVRILQVTDDIASAPASETEKRRGIAGDLAVFKIAGAAAERGDSLDEVERLGILANDRTRTLGVAFNGCTLPGADHPLFTVPEGKMSIGLGIHGEPGIQDVGMPTADELAELLVAKVLEEAPKEHNSRVAVLFNGLGTVKYEELFVTYRKVAELIEKAGYTIVDPDVGEQCTSLDMSGLSLTVLWLDDELEPLWTAPADTPAFRRGSMAAREVVSGGETGEEDDEINAGSEQSAALAAQIAEAFRAVHQMLVENEGYLGDMDAIAGDGDHGIGMVRGARAADEAAAACLAKGAGARTTVQRAADAWAEKAGGTSGALWGAAISAGARQLDDETVPALEALREAAIAAVDAVTTLGGAQVGDKTMVDAMVPFRDALTGTGDDAGGAAASSAGLPASWAGAVQAAEKAAQGTAEFAAKRGRSRTHADKSIGTPDPGAVSFAKIVAVLGDRLS